MAHSKDIENLFGVDDSILTCFGALAFKKSTLLFYMAKIYQMQQNGSAKLRKKKENLHTLQVAFEKQQNAIFKAGVSRTEQIKSWKMKKEPTSCATV